MYYLDDSESSEALILRLFDNLFVQDINGYTFYAHNLGRFDSVLLIRGLVKSQKYKVDPVWKIVL